MWLAHGYGSNYGLSAPKIQFSAFSIEFNQGREKRQIFTYELPLDSQLLLCASALPASYCLFKQNIYNMCKNIPLMRDTS